MSQLPEEIFQKWKHSYEEDSGDISVYRPAHYEFGPARGRTGMELKKDGTFVKIAPGPTDASQKAEGVWEVRGDDRFSVSFTTKDAPNQDIEILECQDDVLKIRRHTN